MRIRELRKEKEKTQAEVAAAIGISRQVFANYENEVNSPDPTTLIKLADYFDVSIDYLVGRTNDFDTILTMSGKKDSELEHELLSFFNKLDVEKKNKVIGYTFALLDM